SSGKPYFNQLLTPCQSRSMGPNRLRPDNDISRQRDPCIRTHNLPRVKNDKSKVFQTEKYSNLRSDLSHPFKSHGLTINTIEVTSLGFISDIRSFTTKTINQTLPTV